MNRFVLALFAVYLGLALFTPALRAEDFKLAGVNMDRLFNDYYKTGQANDRLDKQRDAYRVFIQSQQARIKELEDLYKQLRDDSQNIAFSDDARKQKADAAQKADLERKNKIAEIQEFNKEKMKVLMDKYQEERAAIVVEINKEVGALAAAEGYQLVLDLSGLTSNQIPTVVYLKPELDVTTRILTKLNTGHEQEVADRKAAQKKAEDAEKANPGQTPPAPAPIALPDNRNK